MIPTIISAVGLATEAPSYFRALNNTGANITRGGIAALNLTRSTGSPNGATAAPTSAEQGGTDSVFYQLVDVSTQDVTAGMIAGKDDTGPFNPGSGITNQSVGWVTCNGVVTISVRNGSTALLPSGTPLYVTATSNSLFGSVAAPTANAKVYGFLLEASTATIGTATRQRVFLSGIYGLGTIAG